jgi:hypothetical protein
MHRSHDVLRAQHLPKLSAKCLKHTQQRMAHESHLLYAARAKLKLGVDMFRMRNMLAGASVLAVLTFSAAAQAQPMPTFGGFAWGQYSAGDADGFDADVWSGGASAAFGIFQNINLQGDIGFHTTDFGGGTDLDVWTFGGSAFWRGPGFAFGANIGNASFEIDPFDYDVMNYGAFGEFYAGNMFTLFALGGGLNGDGGYDGTYVGGGATAYPIPNLSVTGSINYSDFDNGDGTEYGIGGEFLFSEVLPVTVYGGYNRTESGSIDVDVWTVGLRVLFGGVGTLAERDRSGALRHTGPVQFRF